MQTPSREEMIRMARETRKQVTNAAVPEELMQQFPVTMKEMTIPFEEGDIPVYYSYCTAAVLSVAVRPMTNCSAAG